MMEAQCPMMEEEKVEGVEKWKVEGDLRSIKDYHTIMNDPKRLKAVKSLAKKEIGALSELAEKNDMDNSGGGVRY